MDHFLVNESLLQHVTLYKSPHDCDNFSDHCPISIAFNINANYLTHVASSYIEKVCWKHANCADLCNYKEILSNLLDNVNLPWSALRCDVLNCANASHYSMICKLHDTLIKQCLNDSSDSIPRNKSCGEKICTRMVSVC